jgi:hypothetical protein
MTLALTCKAIISFSPDSTLLISTMPAHLRYAKEQLVYMSVVLVPSRHVAV